MTETFITFKKGHIGLIKIIEDLVKKGWGIYTPLTDQTAIDFIATKEQKTLRVQAKYYSLLYNDTIEIRNKSGFFKKENQTRTYQEGEFDIYGLYIESIDRVLYAPLSLGGKKIRFKEPLVNMGYYWWTSFQEPVFDTLPQKTTKMGANPEYIKQLSSETIRDKNKKCIDCGASISKISTRCHACSETFKSIQYKEKVKLEKEELQKLLWEKPTTEIAKSYSMTDVAFAKRARKLGCSKPPRGYWAMKPEDQLKIQQQNNIAQ